MSTRIISVCSHGWKGATDSVKTKPDNLWSSNTLVCFTSLNSKHVFHPLIIVKWTLLSHLLIIRTIIINPLKAFQMLGMSNCAPQCSVILRNFELRAMIVRLRTKGTVKARSK